VKQGHAAIEAPPLTASSAKKPTGAAIDQTLLPVGSHPMHS
jgi:hypothetical protein